MSLSKKQEIRVSEQEVVRSNRQGERTSVPEGEVVSAMSAPGNLASSFIQGQTIQLSRRETETHWISSFPRHDWIEMSSLTVSFFPG